MTQTSAADLLVKLSSKFGNVSTKFYSDADRKNALNKARTILGLFDFPELMKTTTLTFTPATRNTAQSVVSCAEPTDLNRPVKMWDVNLQTEFQYLQQNDFDNSTAQTFTREIVAGTPTIYVADVTVASLNLRYIKNIVIFGADGTVLNEWDEKYDDTIIDGAIGWLKSKVQDYNAEQVWEGAFYTQAARLFQNSANSGGWTKFERFVSNAARTNILHR
jgi:hypothetical protein